MMASALSRCSASSDKLAASTRYSAGLRARGRPRTAPRATRQFEVRAHKVEINFEGKSYTLEVSEDENILEKAIEEGIELPCDCMMGVCMTCPAKLVSGEIDQAAGMLSEDTIAKGYTLLCVASPKTDAKIDCIEEEELLAVQMGEL